MKTRRTLSMVLANLVVFCSMLVPQVDAENDYTVKYLEDNFIRIENQDTAFTAGTARTYAINIPLAGSYAVFVKQSSITTETAVGLIASFEQSADVTGGEALSVSIGDLADNSDAYKYEYARIGAVKGKESGSATLHAGECTLTITASVNLTVSYIDIKCTDVGLSGGKRAIYPADYTTYSTVKNTGHVNSQISKNNPTVISGYDYWGDL